MINHDSPRFITVDDFSVGQRLDNYLIKQLKGVPKSRIYRIIRKGEVRVNKGRKKADNVTACLVPGSHKVVDQIKEEGLDTVITDAGFVLREPGCSACLAMNDDKIPSGKLSVSTSNRNFEGRQGPGSRTLLASPLVAAASAVSGVVTDPRTLLTA